MQDEICVRCSVLESILASARAASPYEVVGLLGADHEGILVDAIELCLGTRDSVRVPPDLAAHAHARLTSRGLTRAGTYHSHPRTPAYPTRTDRAHLRTDEVMLIVDVARERLRAFRRAATANRVAELAVVPREAR
jgi:proteasome lid subunit RPN8/RPN11